MGLSSKSNVASASECALHNEVFTHLCQGHLKRLCGQCKDALDRKESIGLTQAPASAIAAASLAKSQSEMCTSMTCRNLISRLDLVSAVSQNRRSIEHEMVSLHTLLGNDPTGPKSVFYQVKDSLDKRKLELEELLEARKTDLSSWLASRLAILDAANLEVGERQKHLLEEQFVRLGWAKNFNANLIKIGKYLTDKETMECLEVQELELILQQLDHFSVVRVNDVPYAMGHTELNVEEDVGDKIINLLQMEDLKENDTFSEQRTEVESALTKFANVYEFNRIYDSHLLKTVDVGAGDFPYCFAVTIVKLAQGFIRIGFLDKENDPPADDHPLGDPTSGGWAFECTENGELKLFADGLPRPVDVELAKSAGDVNPLSCPAFAEGVTVCVYFDRRKNIAQIFVNGLPSLEVNFNKLGYKCPANALNPTVCLKQADDRTSVIRVDYARFVYDLSVVPTKWVFGA